MAYPIKSLPDGRVQWSDGSITGGMSSNQGYVSSSVMPKSNFNGNYQLPSKGTVAGASTGFGGGGNPQPQQQQPQQQAPQGGGDNNAQSILENAMNIIRGRLEEAKRIARERIGQAGTLRDDTLKGIGQFRDRAKTYNAEDLSKISTTFDGIKGNARQTAGDIEMKNRAAARGLNRFGTSVFENSIVKNNENLGKQMGNINLERAGNETDANRLLQDRYSTAEQNETAAQAAYRDSVSNANALENAGLLDYGADANAASSAFGQRLDSQATANKQLELLKAQILGSTSGLTARPVDTAGITDVLNAGAPQITAPTGAATSSFSTDNAAENTNILDQIKKRLGLV